MLRLTLLMAGTCLSLWAMPGLSMAAAPDMHLSSIPSHPWFAEVIAGSVVGWMTGKIKGFSGVRDWVEDYWAQPPGWLVFMMDLIVFAGVGGLLGTAIYDPASLTAALAAGLAWPIGLGSLAT